MTEIISKIRQFLDDSNFHYDFDEENGCFDLGLSVESGSVRARLIGRDKDDYMMTYVFWEGPVPVRSLPSVYPIINDINAHTKFTTICVDPQDGEISCHCGINTDESDLSVYQAGLTLTLCVKTLSENIERIMRAAWSAPSNADGLLN